MPVDVVTVVVDVLVGGVVVVVVVVDVVTVRVGVVTEIPTVEEVVLVVETVFCTVVVLFLLFPPARANAIPPPTSRAMTAARTIQPAPRPRRGLRSAPQLEQYSAPFGTGA